jgi:MFS transporter, FHS family, L-fucose permease
MYPTIFVLAIKNLGTQTKKASSIIVMSVIGGAIFPAFMGWVADSFSMSIGFLMPIPLFGYVVFYAMHGHKIQKISF